MLPLRHTVVFPQALLPLAVNRPVSMESVNRALAGDRLLLLVLQDDDSDEPTAENLKRIGTVGVIRQMAKAPNGGVNIIVEGLARVRADVYTRTGTSLRAQITPLPEKAEKTIEVEAHIRQIQDLISKAVSITTGLAEELRDVVINIEDPLRLVYVLATLIDMKPVDKQALLEENDILKKLSAVATALTREVSLLELKGKIESQAQQEMTDAQRQYYLRQQLKAIQQELGEGEGNELPGAAQRGSKPPSCRRRSTPRRCVKWIASSACRRRHPSTRCCAPTSTGCSMCRGRRRPRIVSIPSRRAGCWTRITTTSTRSKSGSSNTWRCGSSKGDMKGPILCFVGPPGVGKTSLGQSIARAMSRKFVRISLGGVRDEAEIRGHRRTYIGSIPGRIVQALKQAGAMNPVFMLDEIDKVAAGFQGDPAAALLEVLDPAQNHAFRDHYLEVPVDLSKVLFIATANQLGTIHPALLDRMEIIQLAGYSEEEKLHIARMYLLPRQMSEHGLPPGSMEITDAGLRTVIAEYTREAGVRNLERQLGAIARKVAARLATGGVVEPASTVVDTEQVDDYLGPARFKKEMAFRTSRPGVATGLAWTEAGGDVLFIEATLLPGGNQNIILTGQLGNVMQESARAALSHIRANAEELGISPEFLAKHDLHVHVPAGAIPKDGPSAGVTMATAILSAARNTPVRQDVAMTGEITLSGLVLPVGGIREKSLAARRFGIKTVILPALNEPDLAELSEEIRRDMTFVPVETLEQVITVALNGQPPQTTHWAEPSGAAHSAR